MAKRSIEALRPADTPEFMTPAWLGCISFAIGKPEIVTQFREDTGINWQPARSPIERMVDQSTGADWEFIKAFILWVNVNLWGDLSGPPSPPTEPRS